MARQGDFIWYELLTKDSQAAKTFYEAVVEWEVDPGDGQYGMIKAGKDFVGGVFTLSESMSKDGARPAWLGYIEVDDVEQTADRIEKLGGSVLMAPKDVPEAGRIAMVADPQGIPFYIMRPAMEGGGGCPPFSHHAMGHCAWNEVTSPKPDDALAFYCEIFGWQNKESMPMGEFGDYKFIHQGEDMIGAVSPLMNEGPEPGWTFYFHVPDIDAALARTQDKGGTILHGPHEIPGGEFIIIGADPQGARFALVGPRAK